MGFEEESKKPNHIIDASYLDVCPQGAVVDWLRFKAR
jgi:hypothetical protein